MSVAHTRDAVASSIGASVSGRPTRHAEIGQLPLLTDVKLLPRTIPIIVGRRGW